MLRGAPVLVYLTAAASLVLFAGCDSGGGSSSGSSTTAGSTSGSGGGSGGVAGVTSLIDPGPVASGTELVAYRVTDGSSRDVGVEVRYSIDGGNSWQPTTDGSGGHGRSGLATGPAPGVEHVYAWDTAADVPGLESDVRLRVAVQGGPGLETPSFGVDNLAQNGSVTVSRFPYVQSTDETSTLVVWRTTTDTDSVVQFGETPALGRTAGDPNASTQEHAVRLTGLSPGKAYHYRVVSGGLPVTRRLSFETAPTAGSGDEFTFLAFGDSGTGRQEQYDVANQMAQEDPDFLLHLGDVIYPNGGLVDPVGAYDDKFFTPYEDLLHRAPMFPSIGNHDLIAFLGNPYKDAFYLPVNRGPNPSNNELYYSFEWGNAKFISLETTLISNVPVGPHMSWLQRELGSNTRDWLIVYMHVPLYSAGLHGDQVVLQHTLGPLFENMGVDLVLAGHDHNYERTKPIKDFNQDPQFPGIRHIISGGAGKLRSVTPNSNSDVAVSEYHYVRMTIRGDRLHGEAVDAQGQVLDSFVIRNQ